MTHEEFEKQEWLAWWRWSLVNLRWESRWTDTQRLKVRAARAEALAFTFTHDLLTYDS